MTDARHELGAHGEAAAAQYLRRAGMRVLAQRYATPVGELDVVCREGRTIVFVEVKTQRDRRFIDPHERVTSTKQRRLARAARWYVHHHRLEARPLRFDVVSVIVPPDGQPMEIEHLRDAFYPGE